MNKENLSPEIAGYLLHQDCGDVVIKSFILRPDTAWIKARINETGCSIFSIFLADSEVVTQMIVSSKETGRSYDLGARMLQSIDVIRILRHEPDNWILFQHETGIYLDDERANWIRLLATHSSSMPRAKAIDVCKSQNICDLAAALHETGHVVLGHCESPDETYVGGIRRMMSQENEASEYAIQEFIIMANEIGLDQGEVIRAKRLLDVLYYSYVIGYEKRFGLGKFDGIRELNITTQEVELVRIMFEWLVNLYK